MLGGADPAPVGNPDHHRCGEPVPGTVADAGDVADHLVVGRVGEPHELHLRDGPHAAQGQAEGRPHDARLGHGRIDHPLFSVPLLQAVGDPEHPSRSSDVLTEDDDSWITAQGLIEGLVDSLGHVEDGHGGSS
jgi:hypothetical protein